ncbi:DUF1488 domain-containing protein [Pseudoalteromonas mariniglutinosa]|uniref:DUF1488 domain-containing protein n=1 Tax=Pseudoalteromonas mariniglutinosa TaxID=206042 RepID=UPI00384F7778
MNQAIQFIDHIEFRSNTQQLLFFGQVNGLMIECIIDVSHYAFIDETAAQTYFENYRFDYEELAEQLIEDEEYNSAGQIELTRIF